MSRFAKTVRLLTAQPTKVAALSTVPGLLFEEGMRKHALDINKQKIIEDVAKSVATAAITGAGAGLFYRLQGAFGQNPIQTAESDKELGKLNARANHKSLNIALLKPEHEKVLKKLLSAPEFSTANKDDITAAYDTMKRFAPNLAADENAAKSFIREHFFRGTLNAPHYSAIKTLVDTERAVADAGGIMR